MEFGVWLSADDAPTEQERGHEQHDEHEEQELRDTRRCASDTAEAQQAGDQRDDEEEKRPTQHDGYSFGFVWSVVVNLTIPIIR